MFDADEFEAKAIVFAERALDVLRDESERAFWGAASLELLGKAALARHSPTLLADPADGNFSAVLLAAAGVIDPVSSPRTIPAKALWARIERASNQFRKSEAEKIASARNEYLHGTGDDFFSRLPPERWWGRFWHQFGLIAEAANRTIEDLLPASAISDVERLIATESDAILQQAQSRIDAAKVRYRAIQTGGVTEAAREEHKRIEARVGRYLYSADLDCPACGNSGQVSGDDVLFTEVEYPSTVDHRDPHSWEDPYAVHSIACEQFYCRHCYLLLDRWTQLEALSFEESLQVIDADYVVDWDGDYQNE